MGKIEPQLINTVKNFKDKIKDKYGIKRIILFGSAARGEMKEGSDIDLLVVVKKPVKKLVSKLLLEWHVSQGIKRPVDFLGYTEKEFDKEAKQITLASVALKEGIEIV
jgi:predicted nucleotidyltransferase